MHQGGGSNRWKGQFELLLRLYGSAFLLYILKFKSLQTGRYQMAPNGVKFHQSLVIYRERDKDVPLLPLCFTYKNGGISKKLTCLDCDVIIVSWQSG